MRSAHASSQSGNTSLNKNKQEGDRSSRVFITISYTKSTPQLHSRLRLAAVISESKYNGEFVRVPPNGNVLCYQPKRD